MADISTEEYGLVAQAMLACQRLVNDNNNRLNPQKKQDLESRISQAMQVLESVKQKLEATNNGVPLGGSSSASNLTKEEKIYDLLKSYGLTDRV